jgi:hypothetical protein
MDGEIGQQSLGLLRQAVDGADRARQRKAPEDLKPECGPMHRRSVFLTRHGVTANGLLMPLKARPKWPADVPHPRILPPRSAKITAFYRDLADF